MKITAAVTGTNRLRAELLRVGSLPRRALDLAAEEVEEFVEQQAGKHSKNGGLFASIYKRRTSQGWEIGHDQQRAPHALFVHWGTRPHKIKPKRRKALRWPGGGRFFFAQGVNHPGYKGDPWLVRAAAMAPRVFQRHLDALLTKEAGNAAAVSLR